MIGPGLPRRIGTGALVAAGSTLVVYGLVMLFSRFREPAGFAVYGLVWLFAVQTTLWWLFLRVDRGTSERWGEPEQARRRTVAYAAVCLLSGVAVFDLSYLLVRLYEIRVVGINPELGWPHLAAASGIGTLLAGGLAAAVLARAHLDRWRGAALAARELEQERTALRLAALRRQLDPHFLFNSLSTLAAIIPEDPERATRYVEELAALYRHVLREGDRELVPLDDELASAEALGFVLGRRFEDAFRLEIQADGQARRRAVVPLTVLTLVENAVKHNVVTREQPLAVTIEANGETLVVDHPHRPRRALSRDGVGLANLNRSYQLLAGQPLRIDEADGRFAVRVPLLEVATYAHADRRR